jgi:hypothetical protein
MRCKRGRDRKREREIERDGERGVNSKELTFCSVKKETMRISRCCCTCRIRWRVSGVRAMRIVSSANSRSVKGWLGE